VLYLCLTSLSIASLATSACSSLRSSQFGKVYDNNSIKDADGNPITFEEAWDTDLVDGIYMWGGTQKYAADNGGHTLIGSAELGGEI